MEEAMFTRARRYGAMFGRAGMTSKGRTPHNVPQYIPVPGSIVMPTATRRDQLDRTADLQKALR